MTRFRSGMWVALLLCRGGMVSAATELAIEAGWGEVYRAGAWNPVFVTLADSRQRQVSIEVSSPHDRSNSIRITQPAVIGPQPRSFILAAPLGPDASEIIVVVRDAATGRKLAERSMDPANRRNFYDSSRVLSSRHILLGVTGQRGAMSSLTAGFSSSSAGESDSVSSGYLPQHQLPAVPVAYDCLSVLVMNQPDLSAITSAQQQAILQWVRAGGRLLFCPGDAPLPEGSPLVEALPCQIGAMGTLEPDAAAWKSAGLQPRTTLKSRALDPKPGQKIKPLLRGGPMLAYGRYGFGQIAVLSVSSSAMVFSDESRAKSFWKPHCAGALDIESRSAGHYDVVDPMQSQATGAVIDSLGSIEGVGRFDFTYTAIVLIGLMFVVGPVDWFVLRRLGRQPWTWVTTSGWIILVTVGAVYIGQILRSGELHYRSMSVVDEIDGSAVASTDLALIYSPKTGIYTLDAANQGWWEPAGVDSYYYSSGMSANQIEFLQDRDSSCPGPMRINVWSLRYLRGQRFHEPGAQPAMLAASLRVEGSKPTEMKLAGTITNNSQVTIRYVAVDTAAGRFVLGNQIEPGQTVKVNVLGATNPAHRDSDNSPRYYRSGYYDGESPARQPAELMTLAPDVASKRSRRTASLVKSGMICIYAIGENPAPAARLGGGNEQHSQVIRALVEPARQQSGE